MSSIVIDMETRSRIELGGAKGRGVYVYAEDESTEITVIAFKVDDTKTVIWLAPYFKDILEEYIENGALLYVYETLPDGATSATATQIVDNEWVEYFMGKADIIEAHNSAFECALWNGVMVKKHGFSPLDESKVRCTAALAASYSLPRKLEHVAEALQLDQTKDMDGNKLMRKMSKPRPATKNLPERWLEDAETFRKVCLYCVQDVETEYALSKKLWAMDPNELKVFQLDKKINDRGFQVNLPAIDKLISKIQVKEQKLLEEVKVITNNTVMSARQITATIDWLATRGVKVENLQKQTVIDLLKDDTLPLTVRRLLIIRQSLGKSSVSKLDKMRMMATGDGRVKGTFMYHGASTGRWTGKGPQPHNYPRDCFQKQEEIDFVVNSSIETVDAVHDCYMIAASKCLRGMICAKPGHVLFCADFSSIEARVLAWLAGQEQILQAFIDGLDLYKVTAGDIYRKDYEEVTKGERAIGKVAVLALGYQGWTGAFNAMAGTYGVKVPEEQSTQIIKDWRAANPKIVAYWAGVQDAAMRCIVDKKPYSYGVIKFGLRDKFLHARLPSGRLLSWYDPHVVMKTDQYKREKPTIAFWGVNSMTYKWSQQFSYGGKISENLTQAIARDLLAEAMLRTEAAGYKTVAHIHDEIISEMPEARAEEFKTFEALMVQNPTWAEGLPLGADGWVGKIYRKG